MMKDGFIQQIATPQQVFGQPANLFVAGFMGTPQMNCFRNASVVEKDGKSVAEAAGATIEVPEDKQSLLREANIACRSGLGDRGPSR